MITPINVLAASQRVLPTIFPLLRHVSAMTSSKSGDNKKKDDRKQQAPPLKKQGECCPSGLAGMVAITKRSLTIIDRCHIQKAAKRMNDRDD